MAIQKGEYLEKLRAAGFVDVQVKEDRQIHLSEESLKPYLSSDEIEAYQKSNSSISSITVYGKKPDQDK